MSMSAYLSSGIREGGDNGDQPPDKPRLNHAPPACLFAARRDCCRRGRRRGEFGLALTLRRSRSIAYYYALPVCACVSGSGIPFMSPLRPISRAVGVRDCVWTWRTSLTDCVTSHQLSFACDRFALDHPIFTCPGYQDYFQCWVQ